jgi:hypothetical protein
MAAVTDAFIYGYTINVIKYRIILQQQGIGDI